MLNQNKLKTSSVCMVRIFKQDDYEKVNEHSQRFTTSFLASINMYFGFNEETARHYKTNEQCIRINPNKYFSAFER